MYNQDTEKERRIILAKAIGKNLANIVIGSVTVTFSDLPDGYVNTLITIKNEITNTTFTYESKSIYFDYYIKMHNIYEVCKPALNDYRKYVYGMFYKHNNVDKNTIKRWLFDTDRTN